MKWIIFTSLKVLEVSGIVLYYYLMCQFTFPGLNPDIPVLMLGFTNTLFIAIILAAAGIVVYLLWTGVPPFCKSYYNLNMRWTKAILKKLGKE